MKMTDDVINNYCAVDPLILSNPLQVAVLTCIFER